MSPRRNLHAFVIACGVLAHTAPASAQTFVGSWLPHGVPVETSAANVLAALPVADGSGGLFVVWRATSGIPAGEVRVMHLFADGLPDSSWPAAGMVVGTYPGRLEAVSDRAGGIYVAFGTTNTIRCVRLLATGAPAAGWPATGLVISGQGFRSLHTTTDGTVWGAYGRIERNCPIGHSFCENIAVVGARRISASGVDLTGPSPGGFFAAHATDLIHSFQAAAHGNGMWIYYETSFVGGNYRRYLAGHPQVWIPISSGPFPDYSLRLAADVAGAAFMTEGSYATSVVRRSGPGTPWTSPWTYPLGAYGGAYPLDVLANPDGSLLSHSMVFETDPSPHIVDSFVQRILPNGATDPAWPLQGVSTRGPALLYQNARILVPDGRGGCLAVWEDTRAGEPDIYALAIEGTGQIPPGWHPAGTAVCRRTDSPQTAPRATHDALGNLFVTWIDRRNGAADIYAQKIGSDRPVPTTVQRASGRWTGTHVELQWTLVEAGAGPWRVERSPDDVEWSAIGEAEPGRERDGWKYIDRSAARGAVNHYRLLGREGVIAGAGIAVTVPGAMGFAISRVSPNPADRFADVSFTVPNPGALELSLVDLAGRTLVRRTERVDAGSVTVRLEELERLPAGLYWLRAACAERVVSARVLVSR